jgi:dUTP pyrophosphatase
MSYTTNTDFLNMIEGINAIEGTSTLQNGFLVNTEGVSIENNFREAPDEILKMGKTIFGYDYLIDLKQALDKLNIKPDLRVKKLSEYGILPTYGSDYSAGMDVYSARDLTIKAGTQELVATDISLSWNSDEYYIRIAPRSGLCYKNGIMSLAGVIDIDYMKALGVILRNHSDVDFDIKKGDRIAQIIMERINRPNVIEVEEHPTLESNRTSGFGSTGV